MKWTNFQDIKVTKMGSRRNRESKQTDNKTEQ